MEILSAIVQLLGGLALFLYGIELMGDGLKNSSGAALKRVLEKVTGNVVIGVLTGALVTAVIQSSTATIVLTVALIGAGVLWRILRNRARQPLIVANSEEDW